MYKTRGLSKLAWIVLFLNCLLLEGLLPGSVLADPKADNSIPIHIVDMQRIVQDSAVGKAARDSLEKQVKEKRAALEIIKKEAVRLDGELKKQAGILSSSALESKRKKFEDKQRELRSAYEDFSDEFKAKNNAVIGKIVKEIDEIIKDLAEKENYGIVVEKDRRVVLYAAKRLDISDQVIKILDKRKLSF